MFFTFSVLFSINIEYSIVDMPSLSSARYICLRQIRYAFALLKLDMI